MRIRFSLKAYSVNHGLACFFYTLQCIGTININTYTFDIALMFTYFHSTCTANEMVKPVLFHVSLHGEALCLRITEQLIRGPSVIN